MFQVYVTSLRSEVEVAQRDNNVMMQRQHLDGQEFLRGRSPMRIFVDKQPLVTAGIIAVLDWEPACERKPVRLQKLSQEALRLEMQWATSIGDHNKPNSVMLD